MTAGRTRGGRRGVPVAMLVMGMTLVSAFSAPRPLAAGPAGGAVGEAAAPPEQVDPEGIVARLTDATTRGEAGAELLLWIRELPSDRASHWLRLAVVLDRLPPEEVGAAAQAVLRSDPAVEATVSVRLGAARELRDRALGLPPAQQPGLLVLAAHLLEPEAPVEALALRRRYLAAGFEGPDAPEVVLAVARALLNGTEAAGGSTAGIDEAPAAEARRILEEFLERAPEHPMAPEARRLRSLAVRTGGGGP